MKTPHKTILLSSGIALGVIAVVFGATAGIADKHKNFEATSASQYSLLLNGDNSPAELPENYSDSPSSISATIKTNLDNSLTFNFVMAKASSGNFVQLANRGYMYNFGAENGRIKGITAITPVLAEGSLYLRTTNVEYDSGAFLGSQTLLSNTRFVLDNPARYFQLQAGDSGAVITSLLIEYSCTGNADANPSGQQFIVEDFESYTAQGIGYDGSHGFRTTTNLRSAFYSTYFGTSNPNPANETGWTKMGKDDYLSYNSSLGHNQAKCGLFKATSTNSMRYIQTKELFGINSIIGKGSTLSIWMRGGYTDTAGTNPSSISPVVILSAFYENKLISSSTIGSTSAEFTVEAGSGWKEYKVTLDSSKKYYAFGICFKPVTSTVYVPVDDVLIYTTSPYPDINVTGVTLNKNNDSIEIGGTTTLTATVSPNNATNKAVTWTSSNTSVATVNNGTVTGVAAGNSTITVRTIDGGYTATCAITVTQPVAHIGGTFYTTVLSFNVIISFGMQGQCAVAVSTYDMSPNGYTYNASTTGFSIVTTGNYDDYTLGTITGKYDSSNNRLTNVNCTGNIGNYLKNATIPAVGADSSKSRLFNCSQNTSGLQSTFKRRFDRGDGWETDTSNSDRITANTSQYVTGTNSMKVRGFSSGKTSLCLNSDISNKTYKCIGMWVYNPSNQNINLTLYTYKSANMGGNGAFATKTANANSWTWISSGLGNNNFTVGTNTLYNFQTYMEYNGTYLSYDDICLFV